MKFQEFLDQVLPDESEQIRLRDSVCRGESLIFCGIGTGKTTLQNMIRSHYPSVRVICVNECKDKRNVFGFDQHVDREKSVIIDECSFIEFFRGEN